MTRWLGGLVTATGVFASLLLSITLFATDLSCGARVRSSALCGSCSSGQKPTPPKTGVAPQESTAPVDDLAKLQAMLEQPGPDGREARETAVQRLISWPTSDGHRILQVALARSDDPDDVRGTILLALQGHLLGHPGQLFGGADAAARQQILRGYVTVLAPLWRGVETGIEATAANPVRSAARTAMQRMPAPELQVVISELLTSVPVEEQLSLLRCVADLQQLYFAKTLADFIEAPDSNVRAAARQSLQLLTFHEEEFTTKAQFTAWFEQFGRMRYVDLAERAARRLPLRLELLREERARLIVESAVEFVRAQTIRTPGLAWQAISARTLVDDPAVLDACLEQLQKALGERLPADDDPAARLQFCRALLDRWRLVAPDQIRRRALLLEVASYCVKPEETEVATEIVTMLVAQLDQQAPPARLAAIRSLRRFSGAEVRGRLVRHANALVVAPAAAKVELEAVLATLSSRASPRWYAPAENDPDRADWMKLVRAVCSLAELPELRSKGLDLALSLDARDQRLPEVFTLLVDLVGDAAQGAQFRSTCLIHLRGWLDQPAVADVLVTKLRNLLTDTAPEVRQKAAESLARLPDLTDARRVDWITMTIATVRERLKVEPTEAVLLALVNVVQVCGRQPDMAENAIGALNIVLESLGTPVPLEQKFRGDPVLLALSTIAADPNAARGSWLGACPQLLANGRRDSLRLILKNHGAIELAKGVANNDGAIRERAQKAMQVVIETALLKPAKDAWASTEDLQKEAFEVRNAFLALDNVDEALRLDKAEHRLLRLEVELAGGKYQEVEKRAQSWLTAGNGGAARTTFTPAQATAVRMLAAEALLGLNKPDAAAKILVEREAEPANPAALADLQVRIARSLPATSAALAASLFDKALRATPPEDPPTFRARLLEWAQAKIRADAAAKEATLAELDRHVALFDARDCPQEQRDAFQNLRNQR